MENFEDANESESGVADQIFIIGFSRGAFVARSLAGFIDQCGLLRKDATRRIIDAFEISKLPKLGRHDEPARRFRADHGRDVTIEFLAVWDTVGALGDPRIVGRFFENADDHKVDKLPAIVKHAVHALATDEHRELFRPTLWHGRDVHQYMEQRWFVGAHGNVGGGYDKDGLFLRPFQWIQEHGATQGLKFTSRITSLSPVFDTSFPRDPLQEIFYGTYLFTQKFKRFDRPINLGHETNEVLDYTVLEKWAWNSGYRPHALRILLGSPRRNSRARRIADSEILDLLPSQQNWVCSANRGFSIRHQKEQQ